MQRLDLARFGPKTLVGRLALGFGLVTLALLATGATGLLGFRSLARSFDRMSGPTWETADGAMDGAILVERQMLLAADVLAGKADEGTAKEIVAIGTEAKQALQRLKTAGLVDPERIARLLEARETAHEDLERMLELHERFATTHDAFEAAAAELVAFGESVEELGDGAVEVLESRPDEEQSWNGGLSTIWAAADGGMESSIGFLTQLYWIERLLAGSDPERCRTEVDAAVEMQRESVEEMFATGIFDTEAEGYPGRTVPDVYHELFDRHLGLSDELFAATLAFRAEEERYQESARTLLDQLDAIEEEADAAVEGVGAEVAGTRASAQLAIVVALALGIAFAVTAGVLLARTLSRKLGVVIAWLRETAEGEADLTRRMDEDGTDEISQLGHFFNRFLAKLQENVGALGRVASTLTASSQELRATAEQLGSSSTESSSLLTQSSASSEEVSSHVHQVAASIEEMAASVREIASNTARGAQVAEQAVGLAHSTNETVLRLGENSQEIGKILQLINSIAEQTNLLALNATIEAARAGEAGKGFAVVANEIKGLARSTAEATDEIQQKVLAIQTNTNESVDAIARISEIIGSIDEIQATVAAAIEEQSATVGEIDRSITQAASNASEIASSMAVVTDSARDVAQGAKHARDASESLTEVAGELGRVMALFRA